MIVVILLFLQTWRAAIIPIVAIPVSLIGTFGVMGAFGFSLNNLTLFGLVLAIGIVVDDAIVVVEAMKRSLDHGLSPRDAARHTMTEVGTALVSIALVLVAVFVPTAFLGGITGAFFRQFGLTIAAATAISCLNSLTMSPALGALLLRPADAPPDRLDRWGAAVLTPVFNAFNRGFDAVRRAYGRSVRGVVHRPRTALTVFVAMLAVTGVLLGIVPTGFIPTQDQGYLITIVELPKGSSLQRTNDVIRRATEIALKTPGVDRVVAFAGFSVATQSNLTQSGTVFTRLTPWSERGAALSGPAIAAKLNAAFAAIQDAQLVVISPPPVRGIGTGSDFKMMIEDKSGQGLARAGGGDLAARRRGGPVGQGRARVHDLQHVVTAILPRHRPHARRNAEGAGGERVPDAAGVPRLGVRQRLHALRPQLPRHRAGGRAVPPLARGHRAPADAQRRRRHGAARLAGQGDGILGAGPRRAAQRLPGGGAADGHAARRQQRRRAQRRWSGSRAPSCPAASATSGPISPTSSAPRPGSGS